MDNGNRQQLVKKSCVRGVVLFTIFGTDYLFRYHFTGEPSYFVMDVGLFCVIHSLFILTHVIMRHSKVSRYVVVKCLIPLPLYFGLGVLFTELHQSHESSIDVAFQDYVANLTTTHGERIAHVSPIERDNAQEQHKYTLALVSTVREIARDIIWMNIFFEKPMQRKQERAEQISTLLNAIEPAIAPPKSTDFFPKRDWRFLAILVVTVLIVIVTLLPDASEPIPHSPTEIGD